MSDEGLGNDWDERFAASEYLRDPEQSPVSWVYESVVAGGCAPGATTGPDRNAVSLANAGYDTNALDASRGGPAMVREQVTEREMPAERSAGRQRATVRLFARRSSGPAQSYSARPDGTELTATDG